MLLYCYNFPSCYIDQGPFIGLKNILYLLQNILEISDITVQWYFEIYHVLQFSAFVGRNKQIQHGPCSLLFEASTFIDSTSGGHNCRTSSLQNI